MNMPRKNRTKIKLSALGLGAVLVDQVVASIRSSGDEHSKYLSKANSAMDQISSDQSALSEAGISESLRALNELVQSELAMASGHLDDQQFGLADSIDLPAYEAPLYQEFALDEVVGEGMDKSILLAQADSAQEAVTDVPGNVLAQLSQDTPQPLTSPTVVESAANAASPVIGGGVSLPLVVGGALAGIAALSGSGSTASTEAPVDRTAPTASITIADKTLTAGEQTTITITFSELVKNFGLSDLAAPNGVLSDLVQSADNQLIWTAKFVPTESTEDLTNAVSLSADYADLAGNAGASATSDNYIVATKLAGGTVADGYIEGATVFRDLDGDGIKDEGEFSVVTGSGGDFTGLGGFGGTIVAFGGTDISTGLSYAGVLKAPAGAAVINPLTTLVSAVMGDTTGKSQSEIAALVSAAEQKVANLLGIDSSLSALTQIDPIALIAAGGEGAQAALQMQLAAIQVANVLVTLSQSVVDSGVAANAEAASLLISNAFADLINSMLNSTQN